MNVSKHRKEGREGGRAHAASQRNVLLGSFRTHMTISTTPLASQQNLIWQLSAMRSPIRRSIPASGHQTLTVLPGPREHSYSRSRISQLPGIKTFPILPFSLLANPRPPLGGMFLHVQVGTAVLLATGSIAITSIFNHHILYTAIDWSAITSIHHSLPGFRCPRAE